MNKAIFVLFILNEHVRLTSFSSFQTWTERAKGPTGEAEMKKRKRAEGGGGAGDETAEADENSTKKKKSLDPSSKLSAFAFNKN